MPCAGGALGHPPSGRSGAVALHRDDPGPVTGADDVADQGLALVEPLVAGLGERLDDLDRPGGVEVETLCEVVEQRREHRPVGAQQRRLAALEQPREVAVCLLGCGLEALLANSKRMLAMLHHPDNLMQQLSTLGKRIGKKWD